MEMIPNVLPICSQKLSGLVFLNLHFKNIFVSPENIVFDSAGTGKPAFKMNMQFISLKNIIRVILTLITFENNLISTAEDYVYEIIDISPVRLQRWH